MAEKSLGDPLSSEEIIEILCDELRARLKKDCTLFPGLAYAGFTAKFDVKISYLRSTTPPTTVWNTVEHKAEGETEGAGATIIAESYTSPAPDVARQDHDLPIPVLVQTPTGPQRRRVPIERKKP